MVRSKATNLWTINLLSFINLIFLAVTGMINWLLPRGYRGGGGDSVLRHFTREIHFYSAIIFIALILIHLWLHWPYIKHNLKTYGLKKPLGFSDK